MAEDTKKRVEAIRSLFRENGMCGEIDRLGENACALRPGHESAQRCQGYACDREPTVEYTNVVSVQIPANADGRSIDEFVIADVVRAALRQGGFPGPCVALHHVHGEFNGLANAILHAPESLYASAVRLAGVALRYAWENNDPRRWESSAFEVERKDP